MQSFKFLITALAAASIIVASFAFRKMEPSFKRISKIWYYNDGAPNQRIEPGYTTGPVISRTMIATTFKNINNWNDVGNSAVPYTSGDGSSFLDQIEITGYESTPDGDNDGAISLTETLDFLWAHYSSTGGDYPFSIVVDADNNGIGVRVNTTRAEDPH